MILSQTRITPHFSWCGSICFRKSMNINTKMVDEMGGSGRSEMGNSSVFWVLTSRLTFHVAFSPCDRILALIIDGAPAYWERCSLRQRFTIRWLELGSISWRQNVALINQTNSYFRFQFNCIACKVIFISLIMPKASHIRPPHSRSMIFSKWLNENINIFGCCCCCFLEFHHFVSENDYVLLPE